MADDEGGHEKGLSEEALAAIERGKATRSEIFRLRGEFMSDFAGVEGWLSVAISAYFMGSPPIPDGWQPDDPESEERREFFERREEFDGWLVRLVSLADRIRVLKQVLIRIGMHDRLGQVVDELQSLKTFRDQIAHSTVGFPMGDLLGTVNRGLEGTPPEWYSGRRIRFETGIREKRADISDLRKAIDRTQRVVVWLLLSHIAIIAARTGRDPNDALSEYREMNPNQHDFPDTC